jgi:hypothetical protein
MVGTMLSGMARTAVIAALTASIALGIAGLASAHNTPFGFTERDVLRHKARLDYAFSHLKPLKQLNAKFICKGENPIRLVGGQRGYRHIRCFTGLYIPDFLYHLNVSGHELLTRPYVR